MTILTGERLDDYELPPLRFSVDAWYRNFRRLERVLQTLAKRQKDMVRPRGDVIAPALTKEQSASFQKEADERTRRHEGWLPKALRKLPELEAMDTAEMSPGELRRHARICATLRGLANA